MITCKCRFYCTIVFTFLLVVNLFAQTIPQKISFQGKLLENGIPVNGSKDILFSIEGSGWQENHHEVTITDGLYSLVLGSITPIPLSAFSAGGSAILKIYVDNNHLLPDTEILSNGFAFVAEAANDSKKLGGKLPAAYSNIESINNIKGDQAGNIKILADTGINIASDTVNNSIKISSAAGSTLPQGIIVMWSGAIANIPQGWALCDGTNGTPDLRDRFIVGAGNEYAIGDKGGEKTHALTEAEMPVHFHSTVDPESPHGGNYIDFGGEGAFKSFGGGGTGQGLYPYQTGKAGGNVSHENRPPYYALAYIIKL